MVTSLSTITSPANHTHCNSPSPLSLGLPPSLTALRAHRQHCIQRARRPLGHRRRGGGAAAALAGQHVGGHFAELAEASGDRREEPPGQRKVRRLS